MIFELFYIRVKQILNYGSGFSYVIESNLFIMWGWLLNSRIKNVSENFIIWILRLQTILGDFTSRIMQSYWFIVTGILIFSAETKSGYYVNFKSKHSMWIYSIFEWNFFIRQQKLREVLQGLWSMNWREDVSDSYVFCSINLSITQIKETHTVRHTDSTFQWKNNLLLWWQESVKAWETRVYF